jgi:HlyD family secretion protein
MKAFVSQLIPGSLELAEPKAEPDDPSSDTWRGGAVAAAFFIGLGGWAALTPLDAAVIASGVIVVSGNRQAVQHLDGGIVRALHVKEGDIVSEGDVLLELVDTELVGQERALSSRLVELEAQRARLLAETSGAKIIRQPTRWNELPPADKAIALDILERQAGELRARSSAASARVAVLQRQRHQLEARMPGQNVELTSGREQVRLLDDEIGGLSTLLEKGLTSLTRVRSLEREREGLLGRAGRIESEISQTRASISETEAQIEAVYAELRASQAEELQDVEVQLADVAPKYTALLARLVRAKVRAPASGEVVALTVFTVGGVIAPGAHVMDILIIEAELKPENADEVHTGAAANIKFPGLKGRDIPVLHGEVSQVSADRIIEPNSGKAFFRMQITAGTGELEKLRKMPEGAGGAIRPGIPAEVMIPLHKRTALQYIYEPIVGAFWKSFREE